MRELRKISCDVLVIGTGAAGCAAAIAAAERTAKVVITNKGIFGRSGTTCLASVVYAAGLGHTDPRDSPDTHFLDTVIEGRYIGNQELVKILAEEAPRTVYDLERYGVPWYKLGEDRINPSMYRFYQMPSPGHRYNRGVHHNEKTGQVIQSALCREVRKHSQNIQVIDDLYIWKLLVNDQRVQGALGLDMRTGEIVVFACKALVLATGGGGSAYQVTDMDTGATGDGYALALNAGAELQDMEFTQFFPTAFVHPESLRGIIAATSALWTSGLKLYNRDNERFVKKKYPAQGENLPRDILSQCIFDEIASGKGTAHGGVWLDTSDIENWEEARKDRPRSFVWPERFGVRGHRFEVAPTYHFTLGGVRINEKCATNITGLYVAGEVAGGVHGANRLAGNALPECMVFGEIAGKEAARFRQEEGKEIRDSTIREEEEKLRMLFNPKATKEGISSSVLIGKLRETMYRYVGVVRDQGGLEHAQNEIRKLQGQGKNDLRMVGGTVFNYDQIHAFEFFNMAELCQVIIQAALLRQESRGAHFRRDYPRLDNQNWFRNIIFQSRDEKVHWKTEEVKTPFVQLPGDLHE